MLLTVIPVLLGTAALKILKFHSSETEQIYGQTCLPRLLYPQLRAALEKKSFSG